MFLQNWESIQAIRLLGGVETAAPTVFGGSSRALKGHNGTVSPGSMSWFGAESIASATYFCSAQLCGLKPGGGWTAASGAAELAAMNVASGLGPVLAVGSGTAAVTPLDYALEDITTLTHAGYSYGRPCRDAAGWWRCWVGRTLSNQTGSPVTVTELGIYLPLYCGSTSATVSMAALVYREPLPEPAVLAAGESCGFAIKLKFYGKR
jgi:hypothetical protein